jgi:hypothetical protein
LFCGVVDILLGEWVFFLLSRDVPMAYRAEEGMRSP